MAVVAFPSKSKRILFFCFWLRKLPLFYFYIAAMVCVGYGHMQVEQIETAGVNVFVCFQEVDVCSPELGGEM